MNIVALYCIIDDFIKSIQKENEWKTIKYLFIGKRGPKSKLTLSEIVTLNILRFYLRTYDLKTFHKLAKGMLIEYFPEIPNYENFLKATNKSLPFIYLFLQYLLLLGRQRSNSQYHYVYSTSLRICQNYNIYRNKTAGGFASRGRTTKGWFYGYKLHGVCNEAGFLEEITFSSGNEFDNKFLAILLKRIKGTIVCDAGYLLKLEAFRKLFYKVGRLFIAPRKTMKKLMTKEQKDQFRKRSIIETIWGVLKERFLLETNLARNIYGFFRHYFYSISAWCVQNLFPGNDVLV